MKLYAGRYETTFTGQHITGGNLVEAFDDIERLGIRWNVEGYGVERIEATVRAKSALDQYERMNNHLGGVGIPTQRLAVFDNLVYNCVSGFITSVRPEGTQKVTYIAKGPGWSHYDRYGPTETGYTSATTTSAMLINFLEDDVYVLSDDMSNIEETSTPLGGWKPPQLIGMKPADFIDFAKKAGNSAGQLWDYYCIDRPLAWGNLQDFTPYFRNRGNRTAVDWRVSINDLSRLDMDRDISELKTVAVIWYGTYTGTATGGSSTSLIDTGATFLDGRFNVGDEVKNTTDGSSSRIRAIASNTQLNINTLSGGSSNTFAAGNGYSIQANNLWNFGSQGSGSSILSSVRYHAEHKKEFNNTQASQYADATYNFYSTPVQSAAFTISAPWIRDSSGSKRPLWAPIFEGGGLIQITDLYPAATVTLNKDGTNNLDTFFITALDYDYTTNQLRVSVNVPDSRLDARLKMAGIIGGEMVARGTR